MNIKKYHVSKQMFDGTTSATNKRLSTSGTGTYTSNGYSVSNFIPIEGSTPYIYNKTYGSYYNLYDENKQFLYGSTMYPNNTVANQPDARFIKFDFKTEDISTIMFNKGTEALPFEPYDTDVWHDVTPKQYINGSWEDMAAAPEKYENGEWT